MDMGVEEDVCVMTLQDSVARNTSLGLSYQIITSEKIIQGAGCAMREESRPESNF